MINQLPCYDQYLFASASYIVLFGSAKMLCLLLSWIMICASVSYLVMNIVSLGQLSYVYYLLESVTLLVQFVWIPYFVAINYLYKLLYNWLCYLFMIIVCFGQLLVMIIYCLKHLVTLL